MDARIIIVGIDKAGKPDGKRLSLEVKDLNIGDQQQAEMVKHFGETVVKALFEIEEAN